MKKIKQTAFLIVLALFIESTIMPLLGNSGNDITFERSSVVIKGGKEKHKFDVELAFTNIQQSYGLMYRKQLARNEGMLFFYKKEMIATMWMLNTFISLDMIFVDSGGRIIYIYQNATPLSLSKISSGKPVRGVLEVNAGVVEKLGIIVGDQLIHPLFYGGSKG
ncbi:MAG: hypothetical protein CL568_01800 [Alphaproteobacteria bacterium]|nr:hypothetical protein [Alphaproteobacteria bacterium]PPR13391.1 MAG: hypothetical protein CFH42_01143 [Alphaproteobacteria bacterium MarineAlpha12_Bin1]|tara:strand:+ start:2030 stop:2521 length:492 start_codon:yes stop_codon:yes gene_type:complete